MVTPPFVGEVRINDEEPLVGCAVTTCRRHEVENDVTPPLAGGDPSDVEKDTAIKEGHSGEGSGLDAPQAVKVATCASL